MLEDSKKFTGRTIAAGPDLKATLGLVKHLEISKKLIRECVTVPGCCNHLMDSCKYCVCKNTLYTSRQRGVHLYPLTPLNILNPPLAMH